MTLRKKTLLIVGGALIGLLGLLFIVSSTILLKGFAQLEHKVIEENMNRFLSVLTEELENLKTEAEDYAKWDDTFQYMETFDETFIHSNLTENTFEALNLNFIALTDLKGQIIFGKVYDLVSGKLKPIPPSLLEHFHAEGLFTYNEENKGRVSGFLLLPQQIMLVATSPILTSQSQGPSRGLLIMGRSLTGSVIHHLSELTHLAITIQRLDDPSLPPKFAAVREEFFNAKQWLIVKVLNRNTIAGYTLIRDIYQRRLLLVQITMPRETYRQGLTTIHYLNGAVLASALVFTCLVLWLFERLVLARLAILSKQVLNIQTTDDSSTVTVEGNDELAYLAVTINSMIAALRASYQQVHRSERSLIEAQRIAHLGNWTLNIATQDFYWSDETYRIFGFQLQCCAVSYKTFLQSVHPDYQIHVMKTLEKIIHRQETCSTELYIIRQDGDERTLYMQGETVQDEQGQVIQVIGTFQDITELKQAQAETLRLLEENRFLIRRSIAIQEAERRNIARELHDEFGQCITAIQADAKTITELAQHQHTEHTLEKVEISAEAILAISNHMYDVVHSLMRQLRPSSLDDLGLIEALRETINSWQSRYPKVCCHFTANGDFQNLEETINITLYRIVQECLTNIAKYAQATEVTITLQTDETSQQLILCVQDNGQGMDLIHHKRGLGLIGMRERAHALAGELQLESTPGTGVKITFTIPIAEEFIQKYRPWHRT